MFVSELPHLESLSLDITPIEPHATSDPVASPAKAWLHGIVSHVTSPVFSTLNIVRRRIDGSYIPVMTRDDALDMLYNESMRDVLRGFPNLREVNVTLWGIGRRLAKFWTHAISRQSASWPALRGVISFVIMVTELSSELHASVTSTLF